MKMRFARLAMAALCISLCGFSASTTPAKPAASAPAGGVQVQIDFSAAVPRDVEEKTEASVTRDYGRAWQDMTRALEQNRASLLAASFTGIAQEKLAVRIAAQQHAGLSTRYIDHGHRAQAVFYSPDGSAMQLHDSVQLEIQLLEGSSVISRQSVTLNYLALVTATQDGWRVRLLQEIPSP